MVSSEDMACCKTHLCDVGPLITTLAGEEWTCPQCERAWVFVVVYEHPEPSSAVNCLVRSGRWRLKGVSYVA